MSVLETKKKIVHENIHMIILVRKNIPMITQTQKIFLINCVKLCQWLNLVIYKIKYYSDS